MPGEAERLEPADFAPEAISVASPWAKPKKP
jgi:hypothetical protein